MTSISDTIMNFTRDRIAPGAVEGILWENARFILADVPMKATEAKRLLPLGMQLSDPPKATLFIVDYTKTGFTVPYKEAACLMHVKTPLGEGLHCCWMAVDDDTALIYGRELLGYPKKAAEIAHEENEDGISASVTRRGVEVLKMEGKRGEAQRSPAPVFDIKTFNVGGIGQMFAVNLIWMLRPEEVIHESFDAEVAVTLGESDLDPIASFLQPAPATGRIAASDILGSKYMVPVGLAGPRWFGKTFNMRYR
jgi:acetoacetate decarboxylase